jgi:hypothetical protein
MNTAIGKSVPEGSSHTTQKAGCYSACAYAFLGGVRRQTDVECSLASCTGGEYGVHQFYSLALLKNPEGKVFTPIDFSAQQITTGLLLSYVMEMGVSAQLVIEANKTPPTEMNVLSKQQLIEFRVSFDAHHYGPWGLEPYRNGLVAFSRTQDGARQMTLYCTNSNRAELLITYNNVEAAGPNSWRSSIAEIKNFALLNRIITGSAIKIESAGGELQLHVPLTSRDLQALEADHDPNGAFEANSTSPHAYWGLVYENLNLDSLAASVRLVQRNCIGSEQRDRHL